MKDLTLAAMRRWRWQSYSLLVVAFMLAFFHRMAPAVLARDLQQAFEASGATLGILAGAYFLTYTAMQIPSGIFADTLGARKVVAIGCLLTGLGSLLFAVADSMWVAVAGRLLVGCGVSVAFISTLKILSQWFYDRQFATMTGVTILLGNVGAITSATPLAWANTLVSWRSIFVGLSVISFLLGICIWMKVRNRPSDVGLPSMRSFEGKSDHAAHDAHWLEGIKAVLRNRQTWPGFLSSIGQGGMFFSFAGLWAIPYLRDVHKLNAVQAANHALALSVGFAVGALLLGWISDRLKLRRPVIILNFVLCVCCWYPILAGWNLDALVGYAIFFGIGFTATAYTLTLASTKEVNPPALSGMATGVVNSGTFLGAVVLQPLVGWVMDLTWDGTVVSGARIYALDDYRMGLGLLVGSLLLGLLSSLFIKETHCEYVTR